MGDVRFRLFDRNGEEVITEAKWTNTERWSSKHRVKGRNMPYVWAGSLNEQNVDRIMVYSDGLSTVENELQFLSSADLQYKANKLLVSPSSDDISFIDILISPFAKAILEKFEKLPRITKNDSLKITKRQLGESEYLLSWEKVEKAEQYLLLEASPLLTWREVFRSTESTSFSVKNRLLGNYKYKLRIVYLSANEEEGPEIILEVKDTEKRQNIQVSISSINQTPSTPQKVQNPISPAITSIQLTQFELAEEKVPRKVEEVKDKENKAIRMKSLGDFSNALVLYYEIRNIDPTYPRVDVKINELELEIEERARRETEDKFRREKENKDSSSRVQIVS